jgi:amino acid adenylation domain-containing protein
MTLKNLLNTRNIKIHHAVRYRLNGRVDSDRLVNNYANLQKDIGLERSRLWVIPVPAKVDNIVAKRYLKSEMRRPISRPAKQVFRTVLLIYKGGGADLVIVADRQKIDAHSLRQIAVSIINGQSESSHLVWRDHDLRSGPTEDIVERHTEELCKADYSDKLDWACPDGASPSAYQPPITFSIHDIKRLSIPIAIAGTAIVFGHYCGHEIPVVAALVDQEKRPPNRIGACHNFFPIPIECQSRQTGAIIRSIKEYIEKPGLWDIVEFSDAFSEERKNTGFINVGVFFSNENQRDEKQPSEYLPFLNPPFPISLTFVQRKHVSISCAVQPNIFQQEMVEQFLDSVISVYRALSMCQDISPANLEIFNSARSKQFSENLRNGHGLDRVNTRIESALEKVVKDRIDEPALSFGEQKLNYQQLDQQANRIANALRDSGARDGDRIGVCVERSIELIVILLGILKAGAAYVPMDTQYPAERLAYTVKDAEMQIIITNLAEFPEEKNARIISVESLTQKAKIQSAKAPATHATIDDPAYIIYTSGSTGRPKGVVIPHKNVMNLVDSTKEDFDFTASDKWTLFHSSAFDFSVWEIWACLLTGGHLVIVPYWVSRSPDEFHELLVEEKVTVLNQTPSAFSQLMEADRRNTQSLADLRLVIFGGEPLDYRMLLPWFDRYPESQCRLVNMFGITETTVHVTAENITRQSALSSSKSVGRAISGWYVYVMDGRQRLLPPGVAGEIYVGGKGVAMKYWNRPNLTKERFLPDPYSDGIIYRSGDKGRLWPDGRLEHLGRLDSQVQLRGFRIELNEIRAVLMEIPSITAAVVVMRREVPEDAATARLDAYIVRDSSRPLDARKYLCRVLPDYMMPATITELKELPLTTNGKVDTGRLPKPEMVPDQQSVTACPMPSDISGKLDPIAEELIKLWEGIFHAPVNPDDNFFELGGNSLLAVRLTVAMREKNLPALSMRELYTHQTIRRITKFLKFQNTESAKTIEPPKDTPRMKAKTHNPKLLAHQKQLQQQAEDLSRAHRRCIQKASDKPLYKATPQQRRIYFEQLKDISSKQYNLPIVVNLPKEIDIERLEQALQILVQRHEILRTEFVHIDGETYQSILPAVTAKILRSDHAVQPFVLESAPLWRATVTRVGKEGHGMKMVFDIHHIITDAFSLANLFEEWSSIYRNQKLPPNALQYKDYAEWCDESGRADELASHKEYWLNVFKSPPAPLDLPTDFLRLTARHSGGAYLRFDFGKTRSKNLRDFAIKKEVTLFHLLLAIYGLFLARITGHYDFGVGTPMVGRGVAGSEGIQGLFVNTVCLRLRPDPENTFSDYLKAIAIHATAAADHQDFPFDELVQEILYERDFSKNPLFDTLFSFQNTAFSGFEFLGQKVVWVPEETGETIFDLNLQIHDLPDQLKAEWGYSTQLFLRPTVESFRDILIELIDMVLTDEEFILNDLLSSSEKEANSIPEIEFDF